MLLKEWGRPGFPFGPSSSLFLPGLSPLVSNQKKAARRKVKTAGQPGSLSRH
ncbi:hypothetical protein CLOLEP_00276 [[Clostridium] leptum DSM 753]|uniref:Uncharacterized protein n=1 Tax=[Clostridium] leptum DSM 753 TaxID=428125 RepID=A7VP00_9FIRM|nr:hypothetical protein CLOLEP_00276 [[Clostridium] leptum DSM 753]